MNYPTLTKEKPDCVLLCVAQAGVFTHRSPKAMYYAVPKDGWGNDKKEAIPRNKEWLLRLVITSIGALFAPRAKSRCYPSSMSGD